MTVTMRHVGLSVRDLDRTLSFLTGILGFTVERRFVPFDPAAVPGITGIADAEVAEIALVVKDGYKVELLSYRQPADGKKRLQASDAGFAHWAFEVENIGAVIEAAKLHGFERESPPYSIAMGPDRGKQAAYLTNGDGLTVELIGPGIAI